MSLTPLTAASIVEAKLDQLQRRLEFLWEAAHTPLALQTPIIAASYMRQMRLIAFHHDITLSTPHTQLSFCTRCSQVHVPCANASVRVKISREKARRQRRATRRREIKKAKADAMDASDSAAIDKQNRKRKRSQSPGTPSASPQNVAASYPVHEISIRCHSCQHVDFAPGISTKNRALLRESNTDLNDLMAAEQAKENEPQQEMAKQQAEKSQRLLASLQSQSSAVYIAAPKVNKASADLLEQAKARFQQSRAALTGASTSNAPIAQNSFFAEQLKNAVGISPLPSPPPATATTPNKPFSFTAGKVAAAAVSTSSAPFSFSRNATTPTPSKPGGSSLYALLQGGSSPAPPSTPPVAAPSSSPATPFVHSAKKLAVTPKPSPSPPPAATGSVMQGIQIMGRMKSIAASKTYTVPVKGTKNAQKNNQRRY